MNELKCIHVLWDSHNNTLVSYGTKCAWPNAGDAKKAFSRRNPTTPYAQQSRVVVVPINLPEKSEGLPEAASGVLRASMEWLSRS